MYNQNRESEGLSWNMETLNGRGNQAIIVPEISVNSTRTMAHKSLASHKYTEFELLTNEWNENIKQHWIIRFMYYYKLQEIQAQNLLSVK